MSSPTKHPCPYCDQPMDARGYLNHLKTCGQAAKLGKNEISRQKLPSKTQSEA